MRQDAVGQKKSYLDVFPCYHRCLFSFCMSILLKLMAPHGRWAMCQLGLSSQHFNYGHIYNQLSFMIFGVSSRLIGGGQLIKFLSSSQLTHVLLDFAIIQFFSSRNLHSAGTWSPNRVVSFIGLVSVIRLIHLVQFRINNRLGSIIEIPRFNFSYR